jgi:WhiB family redox-sensing transcriptional regulator
MFFPTERAFTSKRERQRRVQAHIKVAKRICAPCPVKSECLEDALRFPVVYDWGIWGGTDRKERILIRRQRRKERDFVG